MADFSQIKALIDAKIYDNEEQAITGEALNEVLQGMVDAVNAKKMDNIPLVTTGIPAGGMKPNVYYDLGTFGDGLSHNLAMADAEDFSVYNEWMFQFTITSYSSVIWSEKITKWLDNIIPNLKNGKTYQVSVVDGLAIIGEF